MARTVVFRTTVSMMNFSKAESITTASTFLQKTFHKPEAPEIQMS